MSMKWPTHPIEATVERLSHEGRGIASIDGKTTFIHNALPGERVDLTYTHRKRSFDSGIASVIHTPSDDRIDPVCAHYERCGGCQLQHLKPESQRIFKQNTVEELFQHLAHLSPEHWAPPLTTEPHTMGYRRKARLGVKYVHAKETVLVGFRERNGRFIADIHTCPILHPRIGTQLLSLRACINAMDAKALIPQIEVAVDDSDQVALIVRHLEPLSVLDQQRWIEYAKTQSHHIYLQPKGPDTIHYLGPDTHPPELSYDLPEFDLKFHFEPNDFTQINHSINRQMVSQAMRWLDIQPGENALDLFSGLGNFSLPMARKGAIVTGVEGHARMVSKAQNNATRNRLNTVRFYAADLSNPELLDPQLSLEWLHTRYDKIILDPARSGAETILKKLPSWQPKKILYVSCHPATLARDTNTIIEHGYRLTQAGIMDMFPHTGHVETMALFE